MALANPGAIPDCVFAGASATGTWTELVQDTSGEGTDLTARADSGFESSSARANLNSQRCVDITLEGLDDSETGYIWKWNRSGDYSAIYFDGIGNIVVTTDGGTTTTSLDVADLTATAEDFVISWAIEPNPDSTSSADAIRSEVFVYNVDNTTYEIFTWEHPQEPADATGDLIFGASDTTNSDTLVATVTNIRLSSAFHSTTETREAFGTATSAPTLEGNEYRPFAMPQRSQVAIGDDGHFSGPVLAKAARAADRHRMLNSGAIVNEVNNDGDFISGNVVSGKTVGYEINSDGRALRIEHLFWRPIPIGATHVVPYVHIQSDEGVISDDLVLYVYSMSHPGPISSPDTSAGIYTPYFVSETITTDHGPGSDSGEWVTMSPLKISRDRIGWSYFCVALDIDTGPSSAARVNTICLDPIVDDSGDGLGVGGIGFG